MRTRRPLLPLIAAHSASSLVFVPIMLGVLFFLFEFFKGASKIAVGRRSYNISNNFFNFIWNCYF